MDQIEKRGHKISSDWTTHVPIKPYKQNAQKAGEYVSEDSSLDVAIHQLIIGHHQSLLVTSGKKIVGILRLTDVFVAVFHKMKECFLD